MTEDPATDGPVSDRTADQLVAKTEIDGMTATIVNRKTVYGDGKGKEEQLLILSVQRYDASAPTHLRIDTLEMAIYKLAPLQTLLDLVEKLYKSNFYHRY